MDMRYHGFNFCNTEAEIFHETLVNIMAADALTSCVTSGLFLLIWFIYNPSMYKQSHAQ